MLCWQDIVYTEVCDPQTYHRVPYGRRGTPCTRISSGRRSR
jgi:phenylacetate-CoA ligase